MTRCPQQATPGAMATGAAGIAASVVVLLAGCAARPAPAGDLPVYQAPSGAPTARLLMRGAVQPEDRFSIHALDDAVRCQGPRRLGDGDARHQPPVALLAAGQPATLDFVITKPGGQQCLVRWTFTPEAGRSYALQGGTAGTGCLALMLDVTQPDRVQAASGAVRRNNGQEHCIALAQAQAAPRSLIEGGQVDGEAVLLPHATTRELEGLIRR